jgi:transposase-like protein
MSTLSLFKWRHFLPDIIMLNIRWYCRYCLSYRDLEQRQLGKSIFLPSRRQQLLRSHGLYFSCHPKLGMGFKSFNTARQTIKGFEAMNMIRTQTSSGG